MLSHGLVMLGFAAEWLAHRILRKWHSADCRNSSRYWDAEASLILSVFLFSSPVPFTSTFISALTPSFSTAVPHNSSKWVWGALSVGR